MYNRTLLIGRIGHNAEAKTDKNQQEYVVLSIATKDSWKNDQGDYESRTEWHRVYAWRNLSRFAKTLQKGQLISVDGQIRYREYAEEVNGTTVKHRVAEIHASLESTPRGIRGAAFMSVGQIVKCGKKLALICARLHHLRSKPRRRKNPR
ncbi:MAG: single-stranded DNA-binding protein [Terracidiphilus sp.]